MPPVTIARPPLNLAARVRRKLGAAVTDGFFYGSSQAFRYLPIAHPRVHGVTVEKDFSYGPLPEHRANVWRPRGLEGPLPVVFYIHGGGFRFMSKDTHWVFGLLYARRGYLVVSIDYRLAPKHRYPAAIEDVCLAWRWLLKNVEHLGGDPSRIAVSGESAGGNLSASLTLATTYKRDEPFARAVFDAGVVPRAVVPACGLFQVSNPERFNFQSVYLWDRIAEVTDAYLHGAQVEGERGLDLADPVVAFERGERPDRPLPPFFIPAGGWDVLKHDASRLGDALVALGAKAETRIYPRGPHAFHAFVFTPSAMQCWRDTYRFLHQTMF
jgi:acetyl esterase